MPRYVLFGTRVDIEDVLDPDFEGERIEFEGKVQSVQDDNVSILVGKSVSKWTGIERECTLKVGVSEALKREILQYMNEKEHIKEYEDEILRQSDHPPSLDVFPVYCPFAYDIGANVFEIKDDGTVGRRRSFGLLLPIYGSSIHQIIREQNTPRGVSVFRDPVSPDQCLRMLYQILFQLEVFHTKLDRCHGHVIPQNIVLRNDNTTIHIINSDEDADPDEFTCAFTKETRYVLPYNDIEQAWISVLMLYFYSLVKRPIKIITKPYPTLKDVEDRIKRELQECRVCHLAISSLRFITQPFHTVFDREKSLSLPKGVYLTGSTPSSHLLAQKFHRPVDTLLAERLLVRLETYEQLRKEIYENISTFTRTIMFRLPPYDNEIGVSDKPLIHSVPDPYDWLADAMSINREPMSERELLRSENRSSWTIQEFNTVIPSTYIPVFFEREPVRMYHLGENNTLPLNSIKTEEETLVVPRISDIAFDLQNYISTNFRPGYAYNREIRIHLDIGSLRKAFDIEKEDNYTASTGDCFTGDFKEVRRLVMEFYEAKEDAETQVRMNTRMVGEITPFSPRAHIVADGCSQPNNLDEVLVVMPCIYDEDTDNCIDNGRGVVVPVLNSVKYNNFTETVDIYYE